ncbi:MAG: HlyD family efflux transporter periplasmic adaptor subunit [Chloroflexota bacterium]
MKVKNTIAILTITLLAIGLTGCGLFGGGDPTPEPAPVEAVQQPNVVSAEAFVVPLKQADLAFEVGGRVEAIYVQEGDPVTKDQLLAELENSTQEANLAQAQASLAQAQATLADTKAGATPEQIKQAEASLAQAEARLAEVVAGPTKEDLAQAEAALGTAQASLAQVLAGFRDEDIQAAAARLLQAEAQVREAQADYDAFVYGDPDRLGPYGLALEQATNDYEAAKAEYDKLVSGSTAEEIAVVRAQLNEAQAALAKVQAGTRAEQIAQTQAAVAQAEAGLAELVAGPTQEKVAVAEAGVQTAEAGVSLAEVELSKTQLKAPFDGTVGILNIDEGELVGSGTNVLAISDSSRWQIETDDLTEIDVVQVEPGARVSISVDALPDQEFEGQVVRITPKSETKAGDVTYTVLIDITKGDTSKLRWGMTTFVDIEVGPEL